MYFVPFVDPAPPPPFTAVLLAGGKSTRMGRDKAGVFLGGEALWQRQLATLRATAPRELFISGKPDGPYAGAGVEILRDAFSESGPLAGLEAALRCASHPLVLVLAIDLPAMTADFLSALVRQAADSDMGCVPRDDRWFEPLAAVYPRACLPLAAECLRSEDRSMQCFVRRAAEQGHISIRELAENERALFHNVNRPAEL